MEKDFEFELGVNEETGHPILNEEEMVRYIMTETGLTHEQVMAVNKAEIEYMEACGLVLQGEGEDAQVAVEELIIV